MFKNYFFIPANNNKYLSKVKAIKGIDFRVFDLEDSVLSSEIDNSIELLSNIKIDKTDWIRIPIIENRTKSIIEKCKKLGIDNYIVPKFKGFHELRKIIEDILAINPDAKVILLIENATSYIDLEVILEKFSKYIDGVSLGIHDFSFETGMKNDYMLLRDIRIHIMLLARAYSIQSIDIVSTYLDNPKALYDEIIDGFMIGYRSKFLIHPFQLEVLKSTSFYSKEEIDNYNEVMEYYYNHIKGKEALFSYKGRVYEKMHIEEIKKIIDWGKCFYV